MFCTFIKIYFLKFYTGKKLFFYLKKNGFTVLIFGKINAGLTLQTGHDFFFEMKAIFPEGKAEQE